MPHRALGFLAACALAGAMVACSPAGDTAATTAVVRPPAPSPGPSIEAAAAAPVSAPDPAPLAASSAAAAPPDPASSPLAQAINTAALSSAAGSDDRRNRLIRIEVLLDRAHFSPGVIDGRPGGNVKAAVLGYQTAKGLPGDGTIDQALWDSLTGADPAPVTADYVITADDVKGPFLANLPGDMEAMSKLARLDYTGPLQLLAERFHMDQALLKSLNPGVDFAVAGTRIVVVMPGSGTLPAPVTRIEVDKSRQQVRAFGGDGKLAAVYPATVGSRERPAPEGSWAVTRATPNPDYTFDPARLTFGDSRKKLTVPPGPNNPVGTTWIGLTTPTYGIHGTPDPTMVGKVASHGCVRLTNWDARQLGDSVVKGARVDFVGQETHGKTA
jgi:lipoprotein-anchoring transpeptidase ErfK/SrfK